MEASGHTPESDRLARRAAAMEINRRRVNEAIERGEQGAGAAIFVCECGYVGCNERVELSIPEYEAVRSDFDRFLIVPGHEIEEVDEVVERRPSYYVVVKREGEPREMASASDPRTG
jgi:hypothetical protein